MLLTEIEKVRVRFDIKISFTPAAALFSPLESARLSSLLTEITMVRVPAEERNKTAASLFNNEFAFRKHAQQSEAIKDTLGRSRCGSEDSLDSGGTRRLLEPADPRRQRGMRTLSAWMCRHRAMPATDVSAIQSHRRSATSLNSPTFRITIESARSNKT